MASQPGAKGAGAAPKPSAAKGCLTFVVLIGIVVFVIAAASGGGSSSSSSSPSSSRAGDAAGYIRAHNLDASRVQAAVEAALISVGIAQQSPTTANVDQVAQSAQQAHDTIDSVRDDFATTDVNGELGNAEVEVFAGANDLKNAMGALVAYTGDPNPATLAHFTTQYQNAQQEWNDGVHIIWRLANQHHPPSIH